MYIFIYVYTFCFLIHATFLLFVTVLLQFEKKKIQTRSSAVHKLIFQRCYTARDLVFPCARSLPSIINKHTHTYTHAVTRSFDLPTFKFEMSSCTYWTWCRISHHIQPYLCMLITYMVYRFHGVYSTQIHWFFDGLFIINNYLVSNANERTNKFTREPKNCGEK